ncbi:beta-1,4-glucuronyltransferase 1-like [Atheta coriaria]|uniref:beta-1,4-glucuronyltransferase 1-like n=1 Tax=Dalotia coriaria TaxID=877792 RepID=UPI0031F3C703
MRCNRRLFAKAKSFVLLTTVLTSLIMLITFVNRRPGILHGGQYSELVSYKYTNSRRPGAFLAERRLNNESYCTFRYGLPTRFGYLPADLEGSPESNAKSSYRVLYNVLEAQQYTHSLTGVGKDGKGGKTHEDVLNGTDQVTYATHVTPEFVDYISEIARSWDGLISVAAFVPDDDADFVTRRLMQACQCLPEMAKVSVHYVFPAAHPPFIERSTHKEEFTSCEVSDASETMTYRTTKHLPYPVNLGRNVARKAASTEYVLVSDVELMPSEHLANRFSQMMRRYANMKRLNYPSRVFVTPVFEIEKYEEIPRTKSQLLKLIREEKALYFHRHICSHCQKFPGLENWLQLDSNTNEIKPLTVVKREYPFHRWEPIYIGTKDEPFYSEALSWEGKQDKMTQMLEMCLKGYRFVILDNAFLIHWPGVKRKSNELMKRNKWRYPYLMKNTRQYNNIINNLATKYKRNSKCKVQ